LKIKNSFNFAVFTMPLDLPNLDDRTYEDLVAEALRLIPNYAPEWTNYNPSDPGITLIEIFAYLTEMLLYRQNRITDDNLRTFLRLLN
jgi:predicted phage baseplate assembly protein